MVMLERHEQIWSGHWGEIKRAFHLIQLKPGTHIISQGTYRAATQRRESVLEHATKITTEEFMEPAQCDWDSTIVITLNKNIKPRVWVDLPKLKEITTSDAYPITHMDIE